MSIKLSGSFLLILEKSDSEKVSELNKLMISDGKGFPILMTPITAINENTNFKINVSFNVRVNNVFLNAGSYILILSFENKLLSIFKSNQGINETILMTQVGLNMDNMPDRLEIKFDILHSAQSLAISN